MLILLIQILYYRVSHFFFFIFFFFAHPDMEAEDIKEAVEYVVKNEKETRHSSFPRQTSSRQRNTLNNQYPDSEEIKETFFFFEERLRRKSLTGEVQKTREF